MTKQRAGQLGCVRFLLHKTVADKARRLRDRLLRELHGVVQYWEAGGAHVSLLAKHCNRPAIFDLRLLNSEPFSLDRLAVRIEFMFSGIFEVAHPAGRRSMLYSRGGTFHLSVYGRTQIVRRTTQ